MRVQNCITRTRRNGRCESMGRTTHAVLCFVYAAPVFTRTREVAASRLLFKGVSRGEFYATMQALLKELASLVDSEAAPCTKARKVGRRAGTCPRVSRSARITPPVVRCRGLFAPPQGYTFAVTHRSPPPHTPRRFFTLFYGADCFCRDLFSPTCRAALLASGPRPCV